MNHSSVTLRIETRAVLRLLATVGVFGFFIYAIIRLSDLLIIFAVSFFLALALNPPVSKLASYLPNHNRILATALAYVLVLTAIGGLMYIAVPPIVNQTQSFINNFPSYISSLADKNNSISSIIEQYGLQEQINDAIKQAQGEAGAIAQSVGTTFVSGISSFVTGFITALTILVLTFLMLIEGPSWVRRLWALYGSKRRLERDKRVLTSMYKVVTGYVNGQVLVAAIGAASVFVTLFLLTRFFPDVPLGVIMPLTGVAFVSALIPMFGATIAAIIITLVLLLNSIPAGIVFIIFFLVYQQIENNVIQPVVQSRTMQLSALSVLAAAIVGISLLGIVGAVMAIPIAGCIRVLMLDFFTHREDYGRHYSSSANRGKAAAAND